MTKLPGSLAFGGNAIPLSGRKRRIVLLILLFAAAVGYLFVSHDYALYDTTIVKITDIRTEHTGTQAAVSTGEEMYYTQSITARVMNGERAGESAAFSNQYSDSGVRDEAYSVGDCLLVELGEVGQTGKIILQKRDTQVYLLAAALLLGMVAMAGLSGILAAVSLSINIALLTIALRCYLAGWNIMALTGVMILLFTLLSMLIANGWNRRSALAIAATLLSLAATAVIFLIVRACTPPLQYQMLEYAVVPDDLSALFFCEIMVGGLGAVMDVAISLLSTADELIERNPAISVAELHASVRAVSEDIMGTMVNVLFFTYLCGGLPEILVMLRNSLPVSLIWEYMLSFELVRFLVGAIGLVLAVPISQAVLYLWRKREVRHG